MKRLLGIFLLWTLSVSILAGCGNVATSDSGSTYESPDLAAFFAQQEKKYNWDERYFMDLDEELLAATYPGLEEFTFVQKIAKMPMMTSVVSEFVLLECESADDTDAVAQILKARVVLQAEGGAWYPESMEAWSNAKVLITDQYVGMIAAGENQNAIERAWNKQFGK